MNNHSKKILFSTIAVFGLLCQLPKNVAEDIAFKEVPVSHNVRNIIEVSDNDSISLYKYYDGPEIHNGKKGGFYSHYHLKNRIGGHSFFGGPSGGVY